LSGLAKPKGGSGRAPVIREKTVAKVVSCAAVSWSWTRETSSCPNVEPHGKAARSKRSARPGSSARHHASISAMSPAMRGEAGPQTIASVLVLAAVAIGRYEFVIGGQVVPLFKGAWVPGPIEYSPSFTEWMLALAAISLAAAIYAFGEKALDLGAVPKAA